MNWKLLFEQFDRSPVLVIIVAVSYGFYVRWRSSHDIKEIMLANQRANLESIDAITKSAMVVAETLKAQVMEQVAEIRVLKDQLQESHDDEL